jgi:hypothetical protein
MASTNADRPPVPATVALTFGVRSLELITQPGDVLAVGGIPQASVKLVEELLFFVVHGTHPLAWAAKRTHEKPAHGPKTFYSAGWAWRERGGITP